MGNACATTTDKRHRTTLFELGTRLRIRGPLARLQEVQLHQLFFSMRCCRLSRAASSPELESQGEGDPNPCVRPAALRVLRRCWLCLLWWLFCACDLRGELVVVVARVLFVAGVSRRCLRWLDPRLLVPQGELVRDLLPRLGCARRCHPLRELGRERVLRSGRSEEACATSSLRGQRQQPLQEAACVGKGNSCPLGTCAETSGSAP